MSTPTYQLLAYPLLDIISGNNGKSGAKLDLTSLTTSGLQIHKFDHTRTANPCDWLLCRCTALLLVGCPHFLVYLNLPVVEGLIFGIQATPHLGTSFPLFHEVRVCERLSNFADKSDKIKHKKQWYSICCAVWVTWHVARGGPPTQLSRANTKIINTPQSRPAAHCFYSPPSYEVQSKAIIWVLNVSIVYRPWVQLETEYFRVDTMSVTAP